MRECLQVLLVFNFPAQVLRIWAGSGPLIDTNGNLYRGAGIIAQDALNAIEFAYAGESTSLSLGLAAVGPQVEVINQAFLETQQNDIVGSIVRILLQECNSRGEPEGEPATIFTGTVDNIIFDDSVDQSTQQIVSQVAIEVNNRFTLRNLINGAVYSDADQRQLSALINPGANADRSCERIPIYEDKTIPWPDY